MIKRLDGIYRCKHAHMASAWPQNTLQCKDCPYKVRSIDYYMRITNA